MTAWENEAEINLRPVRPTLLRLTREILAMNSDWIVVVEPMPPSEAERALRDWMKEQAEQGKSYGEDEIRRDVILSKDRQQLVRFAVHFK